MSDNNDLIREADRRHVIQLFDLFAESPYDALNLIEAYSRTYSRIRADEGSEYHILKRPYTHYSPLHETSLKNAWVKAVCICGGKEFA